jgi:hypothetical protein
VGLQRRLSRLVSSIKSTTNGSNRFKHEGRSCGENV